MKYFSLLFFILFNHVYSQDTITITHKAYKTTFSKSKQYPVKVEWWLTKKMIDCEVKINRLNDFSPDPKLPINTDLQFAYTNSGYDRGHVFPAADGGCDQTRMNESFYFSNMLPQTPQLNRGDWKMVEELTRLEAKQYDSIYVWAGGVGELKKIKTMSIPKQCWKVIYIKKTKEYFAFLFNNDSTKPNGINDNKVDLKTIEKLTGFKFQAK